MGKVKVIEGKETGQPVIGENVIIYTNGKLFGPIYVGDNNIIKAGRIISDDLPDIQTKES